MTSSSIRCGVEPTRKASQQVLPSKKVQASGLLMSSSWEGAQLRCQAATLTAFREFATADEVLEREVEMQRSALRGNFEAASVSGRSECNLGTDECRPVLDEARVLFIAGHVEATMDTAAEACEQSRMYYGRRGGGDAYSRVPNSKPADTAEDVHMGKSERVAAFEAALQGAGRNAEMLCQMAMRAWRKLGDADRAEQLYMEALQLALEDSTVQASYAQFLWQCDA
ncbi:hypothetical protein M758_UG174600 [Ceratodon purpureus]|nr:hypothetical protein M758_UG174600 [Ceratodon purpureus]